MTELAPIPAEIPQTNDDLCTPRHVLDVLWSFGAIVLDPCSNPFSWVDAWVELSRHRGEDGLAANWATLILERMQSLDAGGFAFVNHPYGRGYPKPWTVKIVEEAAKGVEIVQLAKHDPSTEWFRLARNNANAMCEWDGRIPFEGGQHGSGQFASVFFYYGHRRFLFAHIFEKHGDVRVFDRRRP